MVTLQTAAQFRRNRLEVIHADPSLVHDDSEPFRANVVTTRLAPKRGAWGRHRGSAGSSD
jgi:hypothetical protein